MKKILILWIVFYSTQIFGQKTEITKPEMILVAGGKFFMGTNVKTSQNKNYSKNLCENEASPMHEVEVDSFYIGKYEITLQQFSEFVKSTDYNTSAETEGSTVVASTNPKYLDECFGKDNVNWRFDIYGLELMPASQYDHPVTYISWDDANAYCEWLSKMTGEKYSLPYEAEWEFAAKGGCMSKGYKYSGSDTIFKVAWVQSVYKYKTHKVGTKRPNELGIYDMCGNVSEWCNDWYCEYKSYYQKNPKGCDVGVKKVRRGIYCENVADYLLFYRSGIEKNYSNCFTGFRVARKIKKTDNK